MDKNWTKRGQKLVKSGTKDGQIATKGGRPIVERCHRKESGLMKQGQV